MNNPRELVIVTPEHVEIRLTPAGLGSRFLALTIDFLLIMAVSAFFRKVFGAILPAGAAYALTITVTFVLTWSYHVYFESRQNGRSPGKRILGLRVVDIRGLPITPQQSMVRNIVRALDLAPAMYAFGAITATFDRYHRRLGDIVAQTLVIQESVPVDVGTALGPTRHFNSLRTAKTLHLIRHRVSLEEREFLLALCVRADGLDAEARYDLMEEVGNYYRERLAIDDPHLSGENLVRDLTSLLFSERLATKRAR